AEARAAEQRKRRRIQFALAAAVALIMLGGVGFAWWQDRQAVEQERRETVRRQQQQRVVDGVGQALARLPDLLKQGLWKPAVAAAAGEDDWRRQAGLAWGSREKLAAMLDAVPPERRSPSLYRWVGWQLEDLGGDGAKLLEEGLIRHPDDFLLTSNLALIYE